MRSSKILAGFSPAAIGTGTVFVLCLLVGCGKSSNLVPETTAAKQETSDKQEPTSTTATFDADTAAEISRLSKALIGQYQPKFENGWSSLPEHFDGQLPVGLAECFETTDDDRQNSYLRAFVYQNFADAMELFPQWVDKPDELPKDVKRLHELSVLKRDLWYELISDEVTQEFFADKAPLYLASQQDCFAELRQAQANRKVSQRLDGTLRRDFSFQCSSNIAMQVADLAYDVSILARLKPESNEALEMLELMLQLEIDCRQVAPVLDQLSYSRSIRIAVSEIMPRILENTNDPNRVDALIKILARSLDAETKVSRALHSEFAEYLAMRQLLHDLEYKTLQLDPGFFELLEINKDSPAAIVAYRLLTTWAFYSGNEEIALEIIYSTFDDDPEKLAAAIKVLETANKSPMSNNMGSSGAILPHFFNAINSMTNEDFEVERQLLDRRMEQVFETVAILNPGAQSDRFKILDKAWTADETWRDSRLLKLLQPRSRNARFAIGGRVTLGGAICLAAVKRWQLVNNGEQPDSIEAALVAAGLPAKFAKDPFSGSDFKLDKSRPCAVYSVGPDKVDNQGTPALVIGGYHWDSVGDVVFALGEEVAE